MKVYYYNSQPTNYSVTEDGKVYNNQTKKWLKGKINKRGYRWFHLKIDGKDKLCSCHRMVLETYCPNPNSKTLEINHKDGDKLNNCLENLEWMTKQENIQHAIDNNLIFTQPVYAFDDNRKLIGYWSSLAELKRMTGWQIGPISRNCKEEKRVKINGYYWNYSPEPNFEIFKITSGKAKPLGQYDLNGNLIETYPSRSSAAKALNCNPFHISEACNGKIKSYKGFVWKYLIDDIVCSHDESVSPMDKN